jgi:hypothetical protein
MEVDLMELTAVVRSGANAMGAQVLYYGQGVNTLNNCAQETLMDGREPRQYCGAWGHQLHAVHLNSGEARPPRDSFAPSVKA